MELIPGYRELPPPAGLGGLLSCVWVQVADATAQHKVVLPDACSDLVWRSGLGAVVAGPDTGPVPVAMAAAEVTVGVRLRPGAGTAGLPVPLHELRDQRVPLAEVFGRAGVPAAEADPADALRAMLELVGRRSAETTVDPVLRRAVRLLAAPGSRVDRLTAELDLSQRQLRRRFAAGVGYGPKTLHRVLRFQRAMTLLRAGGLDLVRVAAEAGYADQAHLSRECHELGGQPPSRLR